MTINPTRSLRRVRRTFRFQPSPAAGAFARQTRAFVNLQRIIPLFYALSLIASTKVAFWAWHDLSRQQPFNDPSWVFFGAPLTGNAWLVGALLWLWPVGSFLAMLGPRVFLFRALQFAGAFYFPALIFANGSMGNLYHAFVCVSFFLLLVPAKENQSRAGRQLALTAFAGAQIIFSLYYVLAAGWKFYGWAQCALRSELICESPALVASNLIAGEAVLYGAVAPLANFLVSHPWAATAGYLLAIGIQLASLPLAFRPRMHLAAGWTKLFFHAATLLAVGVGFEPMALTAAYLFIFSPFAQSPRRFYLPRVFYVAALYLWLGSGAWINGITEAFTGSRYAWTIGFHSLWILGCFGAIILPSSRLCRALFALGLSGFCFMILGSPFGTPAPLIAVIVAWLLAFTPEPLLRPWVQLALLAGFVLSPALDLFTRPPLGIAAYHVVQIFLGVGLFLFRKRFGNSAIGAALIVWTLVGACFGIADLAWFVALYAIFFVIRHASSSSKMTRV